MEHFGRYSSPEAYRNLFQPVSAFSAILHLPSSIAPVSDTSPEYSRSELAVVCFTRSEMIVFHTWTSSSSRPYGPGAC